MSEFGTGGIAVGRTTGAENASDFASTPTEVLSQELTDARSAAAEIEFKRLGRSRDKMSEIEQLTLEAYEAAKLTHGKEVVASKIDESSSELEKNIAAIQYLIDEQSLFMQEIENPEQASWRYRMRRFGRKAMQWAGDKLSSGSKKRQFVKGALVGGVIATAAGPVFGAGAAAVMAGVRYAKGYVTGVAQEVQQATLNENEILEQMENPDFATVNSGFERASMVLNAEREKTVAKTQERNLNAHKRGTRAMVIGAFVGTAVGGLIHEAIAAAPAFAETTSGDNLSIGVDHAANLPQETGGNANLPLDASHASNLPLDTTHGANLSMEDTADNLSLGAVHTGNLPVATGSGVNLPLETTSDNLPIDTGHSANLPVDTAGNNLPLDAAHGTNLPIDTVTNNNLPLEAGHGDNLPVETTPDIPSVDGSGVFTVEHGHGDTHELIDFFKANGETLSPEDAWKLHVDIIDSLHEQGQGLVHGNYIVLDDHAGADAYSMGRNMYEVGISASSHDAYFTTEAQAIIEKHLAELKGNTAADHTINTANIASGHDATNMVDVPGAHDSAGSVNVSGTHDAAGTVDISSGHEAGTNTQLSAVDMGEGLNAFVQDNYDYTLSSEQSIELGQSLHDTGQVYESSYLADHAGNGNPYGISEPGVIDTGMNVQIEDMIDNGQLDANYYLTESDWDQIHDMLSRADVHDQLGTVSNASFMNELGPQLQSYVYADGSPIVEMDAVSGRWSFVDNPTQTLPQQAYDVMYSYMNAHEDAVQAAQQLAKVL